MTKKGCAEMKIDIADKRNYTKEDLEKLKKLFPEDVESIDDFIGLVEQNIFVRVADAYDYKGAYDGHIEFEKGFDKEFQCIMPFEEFLTEIKKGYGQSDYIQIARLICLSNGIYYDNEYAG